MTRELPHPDLFLAVSGDVPFREALDLMAVPIVSLAKRKRTKPIVYQRGDTQIEVSAPSQIGIATVWDLDFVLWAVSHLNDAINRGQEPSPVLHAHAYDILKGVRRGTSGTEYAQMRQALDRLKATTIRTNIRSRGRHGETFSLLEHVQWTEDPSGKPRGVTITLPRWLYLSVLDRRVLALDNRYFDITSGLGRWLYRVSRKQAGDQQFGWRWTLSELHERSGVTRPLKSFAFDIRRLVEANDLPEYSFSLYRDVNGDECLHVTRRSKLAKGEEGYEIPHSRRRLDPA